jgi:polysaccharide pyruvyl transferase WcaK-like protein
MISMVHVAAHDAHNAGDIFLNHSVKRIFEKNFGQIKWKNFELRDLFEKGDIDSFNSSDAVIVGGGGQISINSFYYKKETGWTLGIPTQLLPSLNTKLIGYAIGYNLFRGESMNDDVFTENMSKFIDKSSFFSLRHTRDIGKLKGIVGDKDIKLNFCPSMVSHDFCFNSSSNSVAFQFAWDNVEKRFGSKSNKDVFVKRMEGIARDLIKKGMKILLVSHTNRDVSSDLEISRMWNENGTKCEVVNLVKAPPSLMADFYYGINTVFSMRGHSQMIPMGLGCKVVSLISHDKVIGLLEDLGIEDTGVEVESENFTNECLEAYSQAQKKDFSRTMRKVHLNIEDNMRMVKKGLEK